MKLSRAFGWSTILVLTAAVGLIAWGLTSGGDMNVPMLIELDSTEGPEGKPETELSFSPVGPVLAILVLAGLLWTGSRALGQLRCRRR